MEIKAMKSFAGQVTMTKGETKEVVKEIADDLIRAKFAEEVKVKKVTKKTDKK